MALTQSEKKALVALKDGVPGATFRALGTLYGISHEGARKSYHLQSKRDTEDKPKDPSPFLHIDALAKPVYDYDLGFSVRVLTCLEQMNIKYLFEVVYLSDYQLLKHKNFGRQSLKELKKVYQFSQLQ